MKPDSTICSEKLRIEFEYHLDGLIEAGVAIHGYFDTFKEALLGDDLEKIADVLVELDLEIFFHLVYHVKKLRRPFKKLDDRVCKRLEEAEAKLNPSPNKPKKAKKRKGKEATT